MYSEHLASISRPVRRRVKALKKLQIEGINVEARYYQRMQELEKEFQPLFQQLHNKRAAIVKGEHEPTEAECEEKLLYTIGEDELKRLQDTAPVEETPSRGIPDFWYHALNNKREIRSMIYEHDKPILKHLIDISSEVHTDPEGLALRFHFEPNEYFANTVLEKHYKLQMTPDAEYPFDYNGPKATTIKSTTIAWKPEMNVTQKAVEDYAGRTTGTEKTGSFFNFFNPPVTEFSKELNEDERETFRKDFKVGWDFLHFLVIPRAVYCYTGEVVENGSVPRRGSRYSQHLEETSPAVRRRIRALNKLQIESVNLDCKFYQREQEIMKELEPLYEEIHKKRAAIVTGEHEPTDAECDAKLVHVIDEDELKRLEDAAPVEVIPSKGIPDFWYHALNFKRRINDIMDEDSDKPILKHLTDITYEIHINPYGFTLRFHFEPNEYFANTVLEKYYKLQLTPDADDPSCYDGPKPTATRGTKIQWKPAKNVTQENAENDAGHTVTTAEKDNSFFNFFDPPITEMSKELSGPDSDAFREDYDIGKDILDLIIPQAVFHYTGELAEDDGLYFADESEDGGVVFYD